MFKARFFLKRSFSYRLFFITFCCLILGLVFSAHIQLAKRGPEPSAPATLEVDGTPTPTPEIPHTLVGSFYTIKDNIEAKLLLNNKGIIPLEVRPTLYNLQGQELLLPPVMVDPNSFRFIDLADWAAIGGESFRSGNIRLFHYGKDLVLGAQIYLTHEAKSLSFEEKLVELGKFDSHRQEGVWWMPSNDADVQVILTNTTDAPLTVTGRLAKKPNHVSDPQIVELAPHATKTIDLREDFPGSGPYLNSDILGLSLEHSGAASALLARTMVYEKTRGYSNIVQFSNPGGGKSSEYQGVGFQIENIAGQAFTPVIAVRNVGTQTANVTARVPYTKANGTRSTITLPPETVQAGKMKLFNTANIVQRAQQQQIKVASIEIEYDTAPGSVIAAAHSVSSNHNQVFRVPMWDPLNQRSPTGGYPWRIEGTSVTETYIRNISDQDQNYVAYLVWEGGGEYMIGLKPIAARETVHIDLKKLRDEQIPDERGNVIPLSVSSGKFQWTLWRKDNLPETDVRANLSLIGRSEQVDIVKGTSSNYACQFCCAGSYGIGYVLPGDRYTEFGNTIQYEAFEEGVDCYGWRYIYQITHPEWSSDHENVATVDDSGFVTTHAVGDTEIEAEWRIKNYRETEPCEPGQMLGQTDQDGPDGCNSRDTIKGKGNGDTPNRPDCGGCTPYFSDFSTDSFLRVIPKIRILHDGTDITSTPENIEPLEVIVGQRMNLTATVEGGTASSQSWTIPEKRIKDFVTSPAGRTPTSGNTVPVDGLNTPAVNFVWYNGGTTNAAKEVVFTASVNGISATAKAKFDVKIPTTTVTTVSGSTDVINSTIGPYLYLGPATSQGVTFTRGATTIPQGFTGSFQFVQLINANVTRTVGATTVNDSRLGLDGCYPYGLNQISVLDNPSLALSGTTSGGVTFYLDYARFNGNFNMFLMFKPDGQGASWVPLKKVPWTWDGEVTRRVGSNPPRYTPNGITDPGNPVGADTTDYPVWTSIATDANGCTQ